MAVSPKIKIARTLVHTVPHLRSRFFLLDMRPRSDFCDCQANCRWGPCVLRIAVPICLAPSPGRRSLRRRGRRRRSTRTTSPPTAGTSASSASGWARQLFFRYRKPPPPHTIPRLCAYAVWFLVIADWDCNCCLAVEQSLGVIFGTSLRELGGHKTLEPLP